MQPAVLTSGQLSLATTPTRQRRGSVADTDQGELADVVAASAVMPSR